MAKKLRWRLSAANVLLLPMTMLIAGNAEPQALPSVDSREPYRISVNVGLVVLNPTVSDKSGRLVSDLHERDFEIYEDGVRQSIRLFRHEDIPVTVGLVVDHSGSMGRKMADVIAAARTFVQSSNPADEMFVVNFNERVTLGLPDAVPFTNRPDELERAIRYAPVTGQTALYDAVLEARERLRTGSRDKKVLIVISDGGDNASLQRLAEVRKILARSDAVVYTIGIFDEQDDDRNPDVLRDLARATGGEAFFPAKPDEVVAICGRIARDIRNQYTLGYVSGNMEKPGAYRNIRVTAEAPGHGRLIARTRAGYIADEAGASGNGLMK